MTLELIPDIPFIERDLDRSGRQSKVDSVDLGEVDEGFTDFDITFRRLYINNGVWEMGKD